MQGTSKASCSFNHCHSTLEILNIWNEDGVIDPQGLDENEGVNRLTTFNPFTATPVEGVDYELRSTFGQPLNENDYQTPRTFRVSVGFRF